MKREPLFYPICQQVALDHLAELPARLRASAATAKLGPEGLAQRQRARLLLGWCAVFRALRKGGAGEH